ncbi:MAG TPA: alpha/beta fold hydrolase [Fusobacterium sp.]|uniref:YheT family hydrolase n=1 Tax=Fusobacterium sp. TaxID=68766 RepID=UPI002F3E3E4D
MKEYKPSFLFRNAHVNTCFPTFFRKVEIEYRRQRVLLRKDDFLDFDWVEKGNSKIIVLCHGLEGSSQSHYIKAFSRYFSERSWDVLALNYRSCSKEPNPSPFFYVAGKGDEIATALKLTSEYQEVVLIGFSLGANKVLDYLGKEEKIPKNVKMGVAVSPPCDLKESSLLFSKGWNRIYEQYFLKQLKRKVIEKEKKYPNILKEIGISIEKVQKATSLVEFDHLVTSQLAGCSDAYDYYEKNSSLFHLRKIHHPTLILTALDDPMMSEHCYPREEVKNNVWLHLETPQYGGHISYASFEKEYWLEKFVFETVNQFQNRK